MPTIAWRVRLTQWLSFFLELAVPRELFPTILSKRPQLCGISLSENLKPTMKFLESLGVDEAKGDLLLPGSANL